MKYKQPLNSES